MAELVKEISGAFNYVRIPDSISGITQEGFLSATPDTSRLEHVKQLQIGEGPSTFKVDPRGMWLGGTTFETARWRIDMDGNMYFNDGSNDRIKIGEFA